jgi:hypothetical protein
MIGMKRLQIEKANPCHQWHATGGLCEPPDFICVNARATQRPIARGHRIPCMALHGPEWLRA